MVVKTETALYPCAECNLIFVKRDELDAHVQEHKGKSDIICKICGKKFSKQAHLNRHMKIHSQNKNYVCSCLL